jgi:hypothetical protein
MPRILLVWLWALPATLLGLFAGLLTLMTGGLGRRERHTFEFCGGFSAWYLTKIAKARAMTLGHVIIGRTLADLDSTRLHEWVHVRQYERWGPFFLPAYLGSSAWLWMRGRHPYFDNPFEVEAFADDDRRAREALANDDLAGAEEA